MAIEIVDLPREKKNVIFQLAMFVYQRVNQHLITHVWTILGDEHPEVPAILAYPGTMGTPGTTWRLRWLFRWLMSPLRVYPCQSILWLLISNMFYCQPYLGWLFPCLSFFRLETCWNHQTSMVPCVTLRVAAAQFSGKEKKVWGKSAPWHRMGGRQPWVLNSRPVLSSKKRHLSVDCTCNMFQNWNQKKNGDHQDS